MKKEGTFARVPTISVGKNPSILHRRRIRRIIRALRVKVFVFAILHLPSPSSPFASKFLLFSEGRDFSFNRMKIKGLKFFGEGSEGKKHENTV